MKKNQWLILLIIWIFLSVLAWPAEESMLDALPIGRSPYRLQMAMLPAGKIMDTAVGPRDRPDPLVRQNLGPRCVHHRRVP